MYSSGDRALDIFWIIVILFLWWWNTYGLNAVLIENFLPISIHLWYVYGAVNRLNNSQTSEYISQNCGYRNFLDNSKTRRDTLNKSCRGHFVLKKICLRILPKSIIIRVIHSRSCKNKSASALTYLCWMCLQNVK